MELKVFRLCSGRTWGRVELVQREKGEKQVSSTGWDFGDKDWYRGSISEGRTVGFHLKLPELKVPEEHFTG